ncbi:hypothetical protein BT69DRAFT_62208 [Atractiella rhizophila]|nr:hypothetical protein BT69DRAFT_62208 [Atractiella rhizophila]
MQSIVRGRSCGSERLSRLEKILPSLSLPRTLFLTYRHRARYLQTMLDAFTKLSASVEQTPEWISVITDVATDALANLATHATYLNRVIAVASPEEKKVLSASDLHQSGCLLLLLVKVTGCFRVMSVSIPDIPHRSHEDLVLTKLLREKFVFFGKHLINTSEKVLILAFESPLLPSLPDSLLHLIAFSVLSSTKTNFVLYKQFVDAALLYVDQTRLNDQLTKFLVTRSRAWKKSWKGFVRNLRLLASIVRNASTLALQDSFTVCSQYGGIGRRLFKGRDFSRVHHPVRPLSLTSIYPLLSLVW